MTNKFSNNKERAEGSLLGNNVITEHLRLLGYPETSINSMNRCGEKLGIRIFRNCDGCGTRGIDLEYHCSLRTCPNCAWVRKNRLRSKFLPILKSFHIDRNNDQLYFLTISPANYNNSEEGIKHIKKSFKKFLRTDYIKERVKGSLWVIETKTKNKFGDSKGWNIHVHAIIYGKRLDNMIRGKCNDCNQNLLKFDHKTKKYYCANNKCGSYNVIYKKDSRIVRLFKKCSKREVNIHVSKQGSSEYTLNYMLKYVSSNKDDFNNEKEIAEYIYYTRKKRLINGFGLFFKIKTKKSDNICYKCGCHVSYIVDFEISELIKESRPPPNLWKYF